MSTLHERLLAELDPDDVWAPLPSSDTGRRSAALRAVVELHADRPCNCPDARHVICAGCPGHAVVCATRLTIADALGVQIGETPS